MQQQPQSANNPVMQQQPQSDYNPVMQQQPQSANNPAMLQPAVQLPNPSNCMMPTPQCAAVDTPPPALNLTPEKEEPAKKMEEGPAKKMEGQNKDASWEPELEEPAVEESLKEQWKMPLAALLHHKMEALQKENAAKDQTIETLQKMLMMLEAEKEKMQAELATLRADQRFSNSGGVTPAQQAPHPEQKAPAPPPPPQKESTPALQTQQMQQEMMQQAVPAPPAPQGRLPVPEGPPVQAPPVKAPPVKAPPPMQQQMPQLANYNPTMCAANNNPITMHQNPVSNSITMNQNPVISPQNPMIMQQQAAAGLLLPPWWQQVMQQPQQSANNPAMQQQPPSAHNPVMQQQHQSAYNPVMQLQPQSAYNPAMQQPAVHSPNPYNCMMPTPQGAAVDPPPPALNLTPEEMAAQTAFYQRAVNVMGGQWHPQGLAGYIHEFGKLSNESPFGCTVWAGLATRLSKYSKGWAKTEGWFPWLGYFTRPSDFSKANCKSMRGIANPASDTAFV